MILLKYADGPQWSKRAGTNDISLDLGRSLKEFKKVAYQCLTDITIDI